MTVAELIKNLQALPQEQDVLLNWEGELVHVKECRAVQVHRYSDSPSMSESYYPEFDDEDYTNWEAVLVD